LYSSYPLWTFIAFAFAVLAVLLVAWITYEEKWAKLAFIISLLAIIIQMIHTLFLQKNQGSLWCWHRSHAYTSHCLWCFSVMVFYFWN
jgi:hypothetical protein